MFEKVRTYNKTKVEVCRNCQGSGIVYSRPEFHPCGKESDMESYECSVCAGSGRVEKKLDITITINPYCGEVVK